MQGTTLRGRTALVTGSTSGIGLGIARALAAEGANIMFNGFGDATAITKLQADVAKEFGIKTSYHNADMAQPTEIELMMRSAVEQFGGVDIVVNNAGIQHVANIEDFPVDKWDAVIAINLTSAFHSCRAAIPIMKAQGRGRIVNLASAHGLVASPFKSAYVAAKHGVVGFTKSIALELARTGVTVNAICPAYVRTPLVEGQIADQAKTRGISEDRVLDEVILAAQPNRRFVEYDELGGLLLYLVSDLGASATGASFSLDGGWTAA